MKINIWGSRSEQSKAHFYSFHSSDMRQSFELYGKTERVWRVQWCKEPISHWFWWEMKTNSHRNPLLVQPFSLTVYFRRLSWPFVTKHESSTGKEGVLVLSTYLVQQALSVQTLAMEQALLLLEQLFAGSGGGAKHSCKPPCGKLKHLHTAVRQDSSSARNIAPSIKGNLA